MNVVRLSNAQVVGVSGVKRSGDRLVIQFNSIITTYTRSYNILECILQTFYPLKYNLLNSHYNLLCITDIVCFHRLSRLLGWRDTDVQWSTSLVTDVQSSTSLVIDVQTSTSMAIQVAHVDMFLSDAQSNSCKSFCTYIGPYGAPPTQHTCI